MLTYLYDLTLKEREERQTISSRWVGPFARFCFLSSYFHHDLYHGVLTIDGTIAVKVSSRWKKLPMHSERESLVSTKVVTGQLNKETLHWQRRTLIELKITVARG
jgi:hypothetical protein